jgi:serine/threonine-protein kinase HipA
MRKLVVRLRWLATQQVTVGQLAEADRRIYFEFDRDLLAQNLSISPFKLPLRPGLIEHTDRGFGPLPGAFDDSLPDGWGMILMNRAFQERGLTPEAVSPLERLAYLGERTMGALTYHPPQESPADRRLLDLAALNENAQQVYRGQAAEVLPELMRAGGSPGGARPKVLVGVRGKELVSGEADLPEGFEPWIIKFAAKVDTRDAGPMEFAYAQMARAAGIPMPETRLFKTGKAAAHFGVRRFDRGAGNSRLHVHTFGNLIQTNFRIPSTDYAELLKVTRSLTRNHQDVLAAFRQMVFNIASHNRDDHAKNFAFIMNPTGEWSLAPAYDLGFAPGPGGEHSMSVLGEGRNPGRDQVLPLAEQVGIGRKEALGTINQVNAALARWPELADAAGCTKRFMKRVASHHRKI